MSGATVTSSTASNLCDKCSVLYIDDKALGFHEAEDDERGDGTFMSWDKTYEYQEFWLDYEHDDLLPRLPGLERSASSGCAFCAALREATLGLKINKTGHATFSMRYMWLRGLRKLNVDIGISHITNEANLEDELPEKWSLRFFVDCEKGLCQKWLRVPPSPRDQVLCDENVSWVKCLLETPTTSYSTPLPGFLPTRLIDLGIGNEEDCIRLMETSESLSPLPRYAALSYCWGDKKEAACQLTTTSHSLAQHRNRIPLKNLTRVIEDTVKTARALSIRYVWIDAICIVQDSTEDWEREAGLMGSVYSNAFLTICPLSSYSCLEGFLNRTPPVKVKFRSTLRPEVHGVFNLRYQPERDGVTYHFPETLLPTDLDFLSLWHSRGWIYQEAQLSTRMLYFGHSHLYYECPNHMITEIGDELEGNSRRPFPDAFKRYHMNPNAENLRSCWTKLVQQYAQRQLTDESDRFPALSGLAKIIAGAIKDEYLAGLWKGDLARGLLWADVEWRPTRYTSEDSHRNLCRTKDEIVAARSPSPTGPYLGPSWSWVHSNRLEYQVLIVGISMSLFCEHSFHNECIFHKSSSTPVSSLNPFGRLIDAKLVIYGKKVKPSKTWTEDTSTIVFQGRWNVGYGIHVAICDIDWLVPDETKEIEVHDAFLLLIGSSCGQSIYYEDEEHITVNPVQDRDTFIRENDNRDEEPYNRNAWGLIIHPIDNGTRYIRVGRFRSSSTQGGLDSFAHLPVEEIILV